MIKLERKKKYGSWIYKEDAPLTRGEFEQILAGDYGFLLRSPYPLCREFYIECIYNMMRPWAIVDYEREPWVMDEGTVLCLLSATARRSRTRSTCCICFGPLPRALRRVPACMRSWGSRRW